MVIYVWKQFLDRIQALPDRMASLIKALHYLWNDNMWLGITLQSPLSFHSTNLYMSVSQCNIRFKAL